LTTLHMTMRRLIMMQLKSRLHIIFITMGFCLCGFSQKQKEITPQAGFFQWPLTTKPGLAANFGELRPNHFHMGLDCRTDKKQNIPVLAAAEGYIAKVKIEPYGFGRCIYINHPSGHTTVYAHLNDFIPALENYISAEQYRLKSWAVFLDIPPHLFPVTKGQQIAFSGNTGGSQGPHLHFEIRETKSDNVLNPSLFDFPLPDDVAPDIYRLAVYDRSISTYEQAPRLYPLKKVNGVYVPATPLLSINADKVSFGIIASDRGNGSDNKNGIFEARLFDNDTEIIRFQMDSISYDETRFLNAHIDYRLRSNGGPYVQHLSRLPGYTNGIYRPVSGDGVILLNNDSEHRIRIEVLDARGNYSVLAFGITRNLNQAKVIDLPSPHHQKNFYPGMINVFENEKLSFYLPEKSLYDSFRFQYQEMAPVSGYPVYRLHNNSVPLQVAFPLKIRASVPESLRNKVVIARTWNGRSDYEKAASIGFFGENWHMARFREFGYFQVMVDTLAPVINAPGFREGMDCSKQKRLVFVVSDNTEELKNFKATLDGKWLRFSNDKGRNFVYQFDEQCAPGTHELILSVEDQVGNRAEKIYHFTR